MVSTYKSIHLAKRPKENITSDTFETKTSPVPSASTLQSGQVIFKACYLSLDPAMRGWLNDSRSYIAPVQIGEVMRGENVGVIIESRSDRFKVGDWATSICGWTELAVLDEKDLRPLTGLGEHGRMTDALSVIGNVGLTAYFGILDVGQVKAGDFVVVSGAAGATGSIVGQIAKLKGATVLGIAGSDDKVRWLKEELGFDNALNYKSKDFPKQFRAATKSLIDVFFDNVGGDILDMALARAKEHARFVICGGISQYNTSKPQGPKNYLMIISMRIRMQGFVVFDYAQRYGEARRDLAKWLAEGKIKRKETIIRGGIEKAPEGLRELYNGVNTGKLMVEISPPDSQLKHKL